MTESLWLRVQHYLSQPPLEASAGLPGHWSFVDSLDMADVEVDEGKVERLPLAAIKEILLTNKKRVLPIALGLHNGTVLWGYATRKYADYCGQKDHSCALSPIVLTTFGCVPAVLNSANVHMVDPTRTLKIDVDRYAHEDKHMIIRLLLCDYAAGSLKVNDEAAVSATPFTLVPFVFQHGRDLPPAPQSFTANQLMDALNFVTIAVPKPELASLELPADFTYEEPDAILEQLLTTDEQLSVDADLEHALHDGLPDSLPDSLPDGLHDGLPDSLPDSLPDGLHDGLPDSLHDGLPDSLPDSLPDGLPEAGSIERFGFPDIEDELLKAISAIPALVSPAPTPFLPAPTPVVQLETPALADLWIEPPTKTRAQIFNEEDEAAYVPIYMYSQSTARLKRLLL